MFETSQEVLTTIIAVVLILVIIAVFFLLMLIYFNNKKIQNIREKEKLKKEFDQALLQTQLEVQEQTMKHIAQEIHDNIGGTLTLAKLNLNTIRNEQLNGAAEKVGNTKELLTKAIADLRTLSKTLHSEAILSIGITKALEMELATIEKAANIKTSLLISGNYLAVDPQKELILFRTVQEALNNAVKHAGATHIQIHLHYTENGLVLQIEDDGQGFDQLAIEKDPDRGSGLRNMQNRTKLIGGDLSIMEAHPGTQIQISLPIIAS